jgi:hypothetical protein
MSGDRDLALMLEVARPSSPRDHGEGGDTRPLGIGLERMRLE